MNKKILGYVVLACGLGVVILSLLIEEERTLSLALGSMFIVLGTVAVAGQKNPKNS